MWTRWGFKHAMVDGVGLDREGFHGLAIHPASVYSDASLAKVKVSFQMTRGLQTIHAHRGPGFMMAVI